MYYFLLCNKKIGLVQCFVIGRIKYPYIRAFGSTNPEGRCAYSRQSLVKITSQARAYNYLEF